LRLKVLVQRFGKYRLCEITPEQIETFKRDRANEITSRGTRRSRATVNRDVAVLSAIFNLAIEYGEINKNPVSNVKYYTNLPSRERVLSDSEEARLFEYIRDDLKLSQQLEILLYTGIRRGELFKLVWGDIDLEEGFIYIPKEITKTGRARIIPMLSNVRVIFEFLFQQAGPVKHGDSIFPGVKTQPSAFSRRFRDVCKTLGWTGMNIHSLRHTFSTRADKYKVGAFHQKAMLGHSKLAMTDRYTHVSKETLKESLAGFEQSLLHKKDTKENGSPQLLDFNPKRFTRVL
jgi:integrase